MHIYDCRKRENLTEYMTDNIIRIEGAQCSGEVSISLSEGFYVLIDYKEIEEIVRAMDGYTGKMRIALLDNDKA